MTIKEANEIDLVAYLSHAGIEPVKIKGQDFWYFSPFKGEDAPTFKVDRKVNRWFDFVKGNGGTVIDFMLAIEQISIPEILTKLAALNLVQSSVEVEPEKGPDIEVISVSTITSTRLINYYQSRRITSLVANQYFSEVCYMNKGRTYHGLGFKNDADGYELRSPFLKGSSHPKAPTIFKNQSIFLAVFEDAFDFASYLSITQSQEHISRDFLILNSTSFFEQQLTFMQTYNRVHLFLDNDPAGDKWTAKAVSLNPQKFVDERPLYQGYKDVNDWHQHLGLQPTANRPLR
jgi:DNA primase